MAWWWVAAAWAFPSPTFTPDQLWTRLPVQLGSEHQNQPAAVNGLLVAGGNGVHPVWDLENLAAPLLVATLTSPHHDGEAESHQLSARVGPDGEVWVVTISGLGVDLWDLTTPAAPSLLASVELEGVRYGDNTEAVWGVAWQGDVLYVGGTSTGLHVIDTTDPRAPEVVGRLPTSALGGVSAGPLWAVGDLLVVTTPKESAGVATVDISDPWAPTLLDAVVEPEKSYIGGFYGGVAYLLTPLRSYDVTTDPRAIRLIGSVETPASEYVSYSDGALFLGLLRPAPGVEKYQLGEGTAERLGKVEGRYDGIDNGVFTDDQFSLPIGNLLVLCDDELSEGCGIGVHQTSPDTTPQAVLWRTPADGQASLPPTTRIGVSFADQVDTRSLTPETFVVRSLAGDVVRGSWGVSGTEVSFMPEVPLAVDTTWEVILPAGGVKDLVGNGLSSEVRWVFSTGEAVTTVRCDVGSTGPAAVGAAATLSAVGAEAGTEYAWDLGDGRRETGASVDVTWPAPGRYPVRLTATRDGQTRSCGAVQVVHRAAAAPAGRASTVAVDGDRVWVVNPDHGTVAAIVGGVLQWEVAVGASPRSLSVADDGRVWVAVQGDDAVVVVEDGVVVEEIGLRWGCAPFGVVAVGDQALVTCEGSGEVVAIDGGAVARTASLGAPVRGLAVSGGSAWVSRFVSGAEAGALWRLDVDSLAVLDEVALAYDAGPDDHMGGRGVPNRLSFLTLSPDGARLAVPGSKDNTARGGARDGEPLDEDNTVRTIVSFVDAGLSAEVLAERLDLDDHEGAVAAVYSPRGDLIFIASQGTNRVDVHDAYDGHKVAGFGTGLAPQGLALDEDGVLWVHEWLSRTVSGFDVSGLLERGDAAVVRVAEVATADSEPLADDVLLGKRLFHNANSREMSADGYIACASCHPDGGHDGQVWDFTDRGEGLRNTIDLRGRRGVGHGPLHWTANFDEVQDFEHDIRGAFGGAGLMADADFADGTSLGAPKAGLSARLDALAAYVTTLDSYPRSPHREPNGAWTDDARRGAALFARLGCGECHAGADLTDSAAGVRHDVGTLGEGSGLRLGGPLDGLDTPTLHGVFATAPYLHDGSAATLADALGEVHAGRLTERQTTMLVAYLSELEGEALEVEGCGCRTGGGAWWLGLVGLGLRRRTRRA